MTVAMASASFFTTGRFAPAATARIADCGGLMMAENSVTPNMPMLEMEKPPPLNSSGFSLPAAGAGRQVLHFAADRQPGLSGPPAA